MRGKIITLCLLGGIAFVSLTTFVSDQIGAKRSAATLTAERESARRAGMPLFVPDLAKPMPPADQNAAVIYEGMPAYNAESPQTKAEDELYSRLIKNPTTLSAADWRAVQKAVADAAPRLRAIHEALGKPACVFHHDYQTAHLEEILLPELSRLRQDARLLSMESLLIAHDGNREEGLRPSQDGNGVAAVANARLGFHLADDVYSDPLLISYLVAVAIDSITANTMQKILLLDPNSPATANAVLASLKDVPHRSLKPALGGESAFEQTMCETIRRGGFDEVQRFSVSVGGGAISAPVSHLLATGVALRRAYWNQVVNKNALTMLRLNRATMAVCDQPYRESQPVVTRAQTSILASQNLENFLTAILLPVETKLLSKRAIVENKIGVTQAAAAVFAYRAAHGGAFPATLDGAMPSPPKNAFDDSPLTYAPTQAGFTIEARDPANPTDKTSRIVFAFPAAQ